MWMAGGGSRPGTIYGETDDFSYNIVKDPVHVHDFHATVLQLLGFDHERFTYRYQGLDQKLTGVEPCKVIQELLALMRALIDFAAPGCSCAAALALAAARRQPLSADAAGCGRESLRRRRSRATIGPPAWPQSRRARMAR